jgi:Zn-dependent protease with chaperone function
MKETVPMRRTKRVLGACAVALAMASGVSWAQVSGQAKPEKISGYAEWRQRGALVVDGQRLVIGPSTKLKLKGASSFETIPLGFEVQAKGARLPDGTILAQEIEARANGEGIFESDIREATDDMEATWLRSGEVFEEDADGEDEVIGPIVTKGRSVQRVERILRRVTPPYIDPSSLRVHVVETDEWNAMAMGNGAFWVYTGLLDDLDDDEVAIVIGHELAHYSHEHSRREFKRAFKWELIAAGAFLATAAMTDDEKKQAAVAALALAVTLVESNRYSRDLEDQADRVGMRYAHEGGFDVSKGPGLWAKFRDKYGDENGLVNFFLGDHSQSSDRIKLLNRELALNYHSRAR